MQLYLTKTKVQPDFHLFYCEIFTPCPAPASVCCMILHSFPINSEVLCQNVQIQLVHKQIPPHSNLTVDGTPIKPQPLALYLKKDVIELRILIKMINKCTFLTPLVGFEV